MPREPESTRLLDMSGNELRNLEAQLQATGLTIDEALALANGGLLGRWVEAGRQLLSGGEPVTTFVTTRCEFAAGNTEVVLRYNGGVCVRWIHSARSDDAVLISWPNGLDQRFVLTAAWQRITRPSDPMQIEIRGCDWNCHSQTFFTPFKHLRVREIHRIAAPKPLRVAIPRDDIRGLGGTQVQIGTASVSFDGWISGGDIILDALRWPLNPTAFNVRLPANEVVSIARGVKAYFDTNEGMVYITDHNQYADIVD